jgi:dipeptidyl aminopeptidase/acylaminoacyl peptidase
MTRCLQYLKFICLNIAVIVCWLLSYPAKGQDTDKKNITEADFHLWSKLTSEAISVKGNWISYYLNYDSGNDTLFVTSTNSNKSYSFPRSANGIFYGERYFICNSPNNIFVVLDLVTGKQQVIINSVSAQFSANRKILATVENTTLGRSLLLRSPTGQVIEVVPDVKKYKWNNKNDAILCVRHDGKNNIAEILDLRGKVVNRISVATSELDFVELIWSSGDDSIAFYSESPIGNVQKNMLYQYTLKTAILDSISSSHMEFPNSMAISPDGFRPLSLTADGERVFFGLRNVTKVPYESRESNVEIWNGNARTLYPTQHYLDTLGYFRELGVWWPRQQLVKQVTRNGDTYVMLVGKGKYALTANVNDYPPQYKWQNDTDFYLTELESGKSIKFLSHQTGAPAQLKMSPDGMFIIYYRQSNWWSYSVAKNTHTNITKGLMVSWDNIDTDPGTIFEVHGIGGWTETQEVIIYDRHDLWLISTDGRMQVRLTKGREGNQQFRIVSSDKWKSNIHYSGSFAPFYNFSAGVVLQIFDFKQCIYGYTSYDTKNGLGTIYFNGSSITNISKATEADAMIYIEQKYDHPPKIVFKKNASRPITVVQSNPHYKKFYWGRSKVIDYHDSKGNLLKGALFYPHHYDVNNKYPMIVYIYETLSDNVHKYVNPSLLNPHGFNISNLLAKGYMVLLPDITYEKGNTGKSALDCVSSAVRTVVKDESVDPKRIGLQGHSFGGFETNFIITQTNLFAAAVSGAAVSDVISGYLSIRPNAEEIDIWRYENFIYRMGGSLYEHTENYIANSPVLHAATITTPILLFAGRKDDNVKHEQSIEFYIALRRLQKQAIMLLYPSEGHVLVDPANCTDLTNRVEAWFDYYLKDEKSADWITKGVGIAK